MRLWKGEIVIMCYLVPIDARECDFTICICVEINMDSLLANRQAVDNLCLTLVRCRSCVR